MFNFLTTKRFGTLSYDTKETEITPETLCEGLENLTFPEDSHLLTIQDFKKGDSYCFTTNGILVGFGEGLQWEGIATETGESLGVVENAWGGSKGTFKITGTAETTTVVFYHNEASFESREVSAYNTLYMKKNYSGTISSQMTLQLSTQYFSNKAIRFVHINPYKSTVTFNSEAYILLEGELDNYQKEIEIGNNLQYTGEFIVATVVPKEYGDLVTEVSKIPPSDGTYSDSADFTIGEDEFPPYYPDQIVEFKNGVIFGPETEEYSPPNLKVEVSAKPDDGDLPGGAIAGIVIACVVVVGVIAFCVVWFAVLKKTCGKKPVESTNE